MELDEGGGTSLRAPGDDVAQAQALANAVQEVRQHQPREHILAQDLERHCILPDKGLRETPPRGAPCGPGEARAPAPHAAPPPTPQGAAAASRRCKPTLVWVSLSAVENPEQLTAQIRETLDELSAMRTGLIIGGRASDQLRLPPHPALHRCSSMAELEAYARGVKTHIEATAAAASVNN